MRCYFLKASGNKLLSGGTDKTGLPTSPELPGPLNLAASDATAGPEEGGGVATPAVPAC